MISTVTVTWLKLDGKINLYRDGEFMGRGDWTVAQAKAFAGKFCEMNGYRLVWAKV